MIISGREPMDQILAQFSDPDRFVGHLNYLLIILSVSMSNMRWLRVFAIASGLTGVVYYGFMVSDAVSATWEFIFTVINVIQLAIVLLAGRRRRMTDDEILFVQTVLPTLEPNLRALMLKLARWEVMLPGEVLMREGDVEPRLVFIAAGAAGIEKNGSVVGVCGPGDFLGEMSFLSGRPASATVRVANEIRCCVYEPGEIKALTRRHPAIRHALEYSFNRNLIGKIERMNDARRASAVPPAA